MTENIWPVSEGTPREDPGMSKGSSRQHGQLVERDMKGGSWDVLGISGCPRDSPDSMGSLLRGT